MPEEIENTGAAPIPEPPVENKVEPAAVEAPSKAKEVEAPAVDAPAPAQAVDAPQGKAPESPTTPATTEPTLEERLKTLEESLKAEKLEKEKLLQQSRLQQASKVEQEVNNRYAGRLNNLYSLVQQKALAMQEAQQEGDTEAVSVLAQERRLLESEYLALYSEYGQRMEEGKQKYQSELQAQHSAEVERILGKASLSREDLKQLKAELKETDYYEVLETALAAKEAKHKAEIKALKADYESKLKAERDKWDATAPASRPDGKTSDTALTPALKIAPGNSDALLEKAFSGKA